MRFTRSHSIEEQYKATAAIRRVLHTQQNLAGRGFIRDRIARPARDFYSLPVPDTKLMEAATMLNERLAKAVKDDKFLRRFWAKVDVRGPDECWPWNASRSTFGYGHIRFEKTTLLSNRVALLTANPGFDTRLCACHRCDNPPCCNPGHLFEATRADNLRDMHWKGRAAKAQLKGAEHSQAVLSEDNVREIRLRYADGERMSLAVEFGVSYMTVWKIGTGRGWKSLA